MVAHSEEIFILKPDDRMHLVEILGTNFDPHRGKGLLHEKKLSPLQSGLVDHLQFSKGYIGDCAIGGYPWSA